MIEHYLTVTLLKKAFIDSADGSFNIIHDGLHPDDAREYGLEPIISVMLTVAKHGIHFQRLYAHNQTICLIQFLADAWSMEKISGLPDVLTVSPELESFYNLAQTLRTIDPTGLITFNTAKNQSYAASLRYAQENALYGMSFADRKHLLPTTSEKSLCLTNETLKFFGSYIDREKAVISQKPFSLIEQAVRRTHCPRFFDVPEAEDWLAASAQKTARMKRGMTIRLHNDVKTSHNCLFLSADDETIDYQLREENISDADLARNNHELVYAEDLNLELSGLECRVKDYEKDFADIISEERLEQSKKLDLPLSMHTYEAMMDRIREHPSVYFPTTAKQFEGAFYCLEAQEPKCVVELVGKNNIAWQYRIFAIMDIDDRTHLVVVDQKYRFKAVPKPTCCSFDGTIDVGPGAMAALIFQLNNLKRHPSSTQTYFYTISVGLMMDQYPRWRTKRDDWYESDA